MRAAYEGLESASHILRFRFRELSEPQLKLHCQVPHQDVLQAIGL